jgi:DNA topoisomerase I
MNLVVVESPSKAKTIGKYLGKEYIVKASKGHVVDLPKSGLAVDIENNFKPEYVVTNPKSLSEIKKGLKLADKLILAVDLDREGEAIGWHLATELKLIDSNGNPKGKKKIERIVFNEITKEAIQDAIKKPRNIDINLVNAQQGRRLLDRLVGYKLSPLLWKKISFGLSAGRVQSVALRLVVEKEEERNKFKSDEYWSIESFLNQKNSNNKVKQNYIETVDEAKDELKKETIDSNLVKFNLAKISGKVAEISKKSDAKIILDSVNGKKWIISNVEKSESKRNPKAPFITSTLQQAGVNTLGFSARRTMSAAQKLYEAGLITYMRTDSTFMSNLAIEQARKFILKEYGKEYLPAKPNIYKSSNKSAQEAHECIRPSDFSKLSSHLKLEGDQERVYNLIRARALSSQMTPARMLNTTISIEIDKYLFTANGKIVQFYGYLKASKEKSEDTILPDVKVGDEMFAEIINAIQHFTEPPARYSEATLIKKMEQLGIGRPSTYASIISTILARKYVEQEGRYLRPTDMGALVNKLLVNYFSNVVDYGFTAEMEDNLDRIAEGKLDWVKMLKDFYFPFEKEINIQDKKINKSEFTELGKSDEKCPKCGSPMVIKLSRYGKFLSCSKFPECDGMMSIEKDELVELDLNKYEPAPKTEDGREFLLKNSKYGKFWAHPDYPKVKEAKSLLLIEKCPLSGHNLVERKGKWGKTFIGCSDYPKCKYIKNVKEVKAEEVTPTE